MLIESDQRHRLTLTPLLRNSIEALHLLLGGNTGLKTEVLLEGTVVVDVLEVAAILEDTVRLLGLSVLLAVHVGETPLLRDDDLLATSELVSRSAESLENNSLVAVTGAHREEDLANVDTGNGVVGLAVSTTHTGLEPIGTSARKHLVDTDNVERMNTHAKVERVLTRGLGDVLVGTDTGSLESLRSDLLVFVTDEVGTEGEVVDGSLLTAKIVDTDLLSGVEGRCIEMCAEWGQFQNPKRCVMKKRHGRSCPERTRHSFSLVLKWWFSVALMVCMAEELIPSICLSLLSARMVQSVLHPSCQMIVTPHAHAAA